MPDFIISTCPIDLYALQPASFYFIPWTVILDDDTVFAYDVQLPDENVMVEMVDVSIPVLPVKRLLFQYSYTNTETQHSMYIDKLLSRLGPEWSLSNLRLPFKGPIPDDSSTNYILCFMVPQLKKVHVVTGPQRLLT